jgi:glucokinase-like ROK family protein
MSYTNVIQPCAKVRSTYLSFEEKGEEMLDLSEAQMLSDLMNFLRTTGASTRPEISRATGLSRTLVAKYVDLAIEEGLAIEGDLGTSTGGRAPRIVEFNHKTGYLLLAELGATGLSVAVSDLRGNIGDVHSIPIDIAEGPEIVLKEVDQAFKKLKSHHKGVLWGIGIGLPGPVEFSTGLPMSPPIMPGWDRSLVREQFMKTFNAPVWVDNDVNLMALGEYSLNQNAKNQELIYIKIGSGIGGGIISKGILHRGAQGCAGDIGHIAVGEPTNIICRCGNVGCLEALAGGAALARDANQAAIDSLSPYLQQQLEKNGEVTGVDVTQGALRGDNWCVDAITRAGQQIGKILATLVNFHNPSVIVIGGGVSSAGNLLLASIRQTVYSRSLPLATRDLEIRLGDTGDSSGLHGAAEMIMSELFSPAILRQWVDNAHPTLPILYQSEILA